MSPTSSSPRLDWGRGPFEVSPERDALRRAIVASPTDLALRERYAAQAVAEHDPRGEYVRLGCLREKAGADEVGAIDEAMEDLRARYGRAIYAEWLGSDFGAWVGRINRDATTHERLGFVSHVAARAGDLQELRAIAPLETVTPLAGWRSAGRTWIVPATSTWHPRDLKDPPFGALVRLFPGARRVHVNNQTLTTDELEALGALAELDTLGFVHRAPAALDRIAARPGAFPSLQTLQLWGCATDAADVAVVAQRCRLRHLSLEVNATDQLQILLEGLAGAPLETLELSGIAPDYHGDLGLAAFRHARLPRLQSLTLDEYTLRDLDGLADAPLLRNLRKLGLRGIDNGDEAVDALRTALAGSSLRELSLVGSRLGADAYRRLAKSGALEGIESLSLGFPRTSLDVVLELSSAAPRLKSLDLTDTPMASAVLEATLRTRTLRSLHARSFSDGPEDIVRVVAAAPEPLSLRSLTLPDLAQVDLPSLDRLVRAPALREIGSVATVAYQPLDSERNALMLRRFGHRWIAPPADRGLAAGGPSRGSLPEPDLDPWWG